MTDVTPDKPRRVWKTTLVRSLIALVLIALGVGAWMVYLCLAISLQAEKNLHATLFTIRLVEQFVAENGRWPRSWDELERLSVSSDAPSPMNGEITVVRIGGQQGYDWPAAAAEIQDCVLIDFETDPLEVANQDPMSFVAIKPIGPCYEYRDYGFVDSLQATIRNSVKGDDP